MTLSELLSVFSYDTKIDLNLLNSHGVTEHLYSGIIYGYKTRLNETWPDNLFDEFNIVCCQLKDNAINIIIEG